MISLFSSSLFLSSITLSSIFRVIYPLSPGNSTAFLAYGEGTMSPMQEDPTLAPWKRLGETLAGSFAARARGLLATDFDIFGREGEEIGRLRIDGTEGAELEAGDLKARIERSEHTGYTMLSNGATILAAEPAGALITPEIRCVGRPYKGRLSLLRNTAEAGPAGTKRRRALPEASRIGTTRPSSTPATKAPYPSPSSSSSLPSRSDAGPTTSCIRDEPSCTTSHQYVSHQRLATKRLTC